MLYAFDVYYGPASAKAVGIAFADWKQEKPDAVWENVLTEVASYTPGEFYKRELPCLLSLLENAPLGKPRGIVIDGYVWLQAQKAGLGMHLYHALDAQIPIIGVAKSYFHDTQATPVYRGESKSPLYVSCVGLPLEEATAWIAAMHGAFRMPTLLKSLDAITRITNIQENNRV